ncbi:hypothetical protein L208DRAFT_1406760 [Tricholoma matsutake]|nr:hypothetical protein L208DRAFT_1406760 [Tricholoma matsutake 945]
MPSATLTGQTASTLIVALGFYMLSGFRLISSTLDLNKDSTKISPGNEQRHITQACITSTLKPCEGCT